MPGSLAGERVGDIAFIKIRPKEEAAITPAVEEGIVSSEPFL